MNGGYHRGPQTDYRAQGLQFRLLRPTLQLLAMAFLIVSLSQPAQAQVLYGSIVGQVSDSSGAVVPRATVKVTHIETNETISTSTNSAGLYAFNSIPAGTYDVTITAPGFSAFKAVKTPVGINTVVRVDATLPVGELRQSVNVSAESARLETDRADVHEDITATQFEDLPQATRTYEGLLALVAGVTPPAADSGGTNNPAKSMILSANGTSNEGTDVRIEGVSAVNAWVQFFSTAVPSTEAIQSVNMVTNSADVDQSLASGATINVQLKGGTNQFHGEVYEYHEDNALKARPFFLPPDQGKPKNIDNDLGGTLGGPIIKNKLFFFGSYEGDFLRTVSGEFGTVPTDAIKNGYFSQTGTPIYNPSTGNPDGTGKTQFLNNQIPSGMISSVAQKLDAMVPEPNTSIFGPNTNNFYGNLPVHYNLQKIDAKVDWVATPKLRISGRAEVQPYLVSQVAIFGNTLGTEGNAGWPNMSQNGKIFGFTGSASYVVSPTFIVDGSVGFNRANQYILGQDGTTKYTLNTLGIPGTNIGPLPQGGGIADFSINGYTGYGAAYNYLQYLDPVFGYSARATWVRGSHTIKFGANVVRQHMNHIETGPDGFTFSGGVTALNGGSSPNQFNGYADFLLGLPSQWNNAYLWKPEVKLRLREYSLYVGDKWTATKKLTVSYGTGWELFPVPTHDDHGLDIYVPATNSYEICGYGSIPKSCGIKVEKNLFAPKLGIAYRPAESLVLRAGYSLSTEQADMAQDGFNDYPEVLGYNASAVNPFVPVGTLTAGIPTQPIPNVSTGVIPLVPGISFQTDPLNFIRGYVQSYNVTVQKGFGAWVAQVAYVGTHSLHGHSRHDMNYGQVGGGVASEPLYKLDGISNFEGEILPEINMTYNSLQASLERHFAHGIQMRANYTYSKWIGVCCSTNADSRPEIAIPQYSYLNRAIEPNDLTNVFNFSGIFQLPFGKEKRYLNQGGVGSALLGGWQLNALLTAHSGYPFSIGADGTSLNAPGSTQRADQVKPQVAMPRTLNEWFDPYAFAPVPAGQARFGTAGYDSVRGPGATDLDLGLFRDFRLTERLKLQFRAEAFNFTNTPHFSNPGNYVSSVQYATNPDGSANYNQIVNLNGFDQITSTNPGSRLVDERYWRLGLKILF
jgi:hypothetical protein